jgi:hypothetical protein
MNKYSKYEQGRTNTAHSIVFISEKLHSAGGIVDVLLNIELMGPDKI